MRRYVGILVALFLVAAATGYAQDQPPWGRLVIMQTSRWGDGLSGIVKNFGPGKMFGMRDGMRDVVAFVN